MPTSFSPLLFYKDKDLLSALEQHGTPLPLSLSTLRKDRLDGRAGGIPYRRNGGFILYSPAEVLEFFTTYQKFMGTQTNKSL